MSRNVPTSFKGRGGTITTKRQRVSGRRRRRISFHPTKHAQFQDPPTKKVKKSTNVCVCARINSSIAHEVCWVYIGDTKMIHSIIKEDVLRIQMDQCMLQ